MYGAGGVFAEPAGLKSVGVGDVSCGGAVELSGFLVGETATCELCEFVGGPRSRAEEGSKIEGRDGGWYVGFLDKGDGAKLGTSAVRQFGSWWSCCTWRVFIAFEFWRL
jgi:hypothetical protein